MIELPPMPSWDGLHPLITHFPIALLLVAPLFVVLGLVVPAYRRAFMNAALLLMLLGTISTFVAISTGEASGKLAERSPEIYAVLGHHEQLAENTRVIFAVLTIVFAGLLYGPKLARRSLEGTALVAVAVLYLLVYGAGAVVLANTAHNGGRLVHEFGVRSLMPATPLPAVAQEADDD